MTRLWATMIWDVRLQIRYGFYFVGAFVAVIWVVLLSQLPPDGLRYLLPPFLVVNLLMTTFYFVSGLVLLEKGQRSLQSVIITPLRWDEYLISKAATLTGLASLECILIVLLTHGFAFDWLCLMSGMVLLAVIYVWLGLVAVSRYDSINAFILPSAVIVTVLMLPLLDYLDLWRHWLFYLLPTQPPLLLLKSAFEPVGTGLMIYAVLASVLWAAVGYYASRKVFHRFVEAV